jgi:DNA-3-methyladenine glycosylase II
VPIARLTRRSLRAAAARLADLDPVLGASYAQFGPPPLWAREPTYATLVHLILEQQVSLASAQAAFDRLAQAIGQVTPATLLMLDDQQLRAIGFSRQKTGYARDLAQALLDGFSLDALTSLPDDDVRSALTRHRGIGRWTADIYLTMCLLRPDIWPRGDLALATAAHEIGATAERPADADLAGIAERWAPDRAVAARMLWHHYLRARGLPVD